MTTKFEQFVQAFDGKVKIIAEPYEPIDPIDPENSTDIFEYNSRQKSEAFGFIGNRLLDILCRIDMNHSRNSFKDKERENLSTIDVFNCIDNANGVGCDYIYTMETGGFTLFLDEYLNLPHGDYEDCNE